MERVLYVTGVDRDCHGGKVLAPFPKVYFAPIEETDRKWTWKSEYEYAASRPAGKKDVVLVNNVLCPCVSANKK